MDGEKDKENLFPDAKKAILTNYKPPTSSQGDNMDSLNKVQKQQTNLTEPSTGSEPLSIDGAKVLASKSMSKSVMASNNHHPVCDDHLKDQGYSESILPRPPDIGDGGGSHSSLVFSGASALSTATAVTAAMTVGMKPLVHKRIPHLHKLEKKHSSGDLHSRLKTRKVLGVGETDDGDVHRSKLSQILGHSDQLYIRLPYGLRLWQLLLALMFSLIGLWALVFPSHLFQTTLETPATDLVVLPLRLYGGALLSLSLVFWVTIQSQDRDIIRMSLLISILYFVIQFLVSAFSSHTVALPISGLCGPYVDIVCRLGRVLTSFYFYLVLTRDSRHYR